MRRSNALLAVLVGLLVVLCLPGAAQAAELAGGTVVNVGHRGTAGLAPEHTMASYDLALENGADYIEQDLRMTSDGVLVILHDEDLDRTTRGPLEEVFRRYGTETNYYIETRSAEAPPGNPGIDASSDMEEELLRLMDEYGLSEPAAGSWRVLIQSFVPASLEEIHAEDPSLPLVQLYSDEETGEAIRADLATAGEYAVGVGPSMDDVDRGLVEAAHAECLAVHPYTLLEEPDMREMIDLGVDGMFTDFANRLEGVLGEEASDGNSAAVESAEASRACLSGTASEVPDTGGIPLLPYAALGALLLSACLLAAGLRRA